MCEPRQKEVETKMYQLQVDGKTIGKCFERKELGQRFADFFQGFGHKVKIVEVE